MLHSACTSVSYRPSSVVGWFSSISSFHFSLPLQILMINKDLFLKFSILWSFLCATYAPYLRRRLIRLAPVSFQHLTSWKTTNAWFLLVGMMFIHVQLGSGAHTIAGPSREARDIWLKPALPVSAFLLPESVLTGVTLDCKLLIWNAKVFVICFWLLLEHIGDNSCFL